jgi:uncharacterized membrane protein
MPDAVPFDEWMEHTVRGFEVVGVAILALGSLAALASTAPMLLRGELQAAYKRARQMVGHSVLLGLEVLIIADIVQTITIDSTVESAASLGLIVLVRTFLSFSLEIELDGIVPWRRWMLTEETRSAGDGPSMPDTRTGG